MPEPSKAQRECIHGVPAGKGCARCRADLQPVGRRGQIVDLDTNRNGFIFDPEPDHLETNHYFHPFDPGVTQTD